MKRDPLLYGVIGALIGGIVVWFLSVNAVNNNMTGMMGMMGMRRMQQEAKPMMQQVEDQDSMVTGKGMEMSMNGMMRALDEKNGEEFDQTFILQMIDHHQGAIEMAKEALNKAEKEEIKNLAKDIIAAQTKEIEMMRQWQKDWGF